jgi:hypothetical protein
MRHILFIIVLISTSIFANELKRSKNQELAYVLGTMNILYSSKNLGKDPIYVTVIQSYEEIGECWGKIDSCPNSRLSIITSMGDLYEAPQLYVLPVSKGWEFVSRNITGNGELIIKVKTVLPSNNIEPKERESWIGKTYNLKFRADSIPTFAVQ